MVPTVASTSAYPFSSLARAPPPAPPRPSPPSSRPPCDSLLLLRPDGGGFPSAPPFPDPPAAASCIAAPFRFCIAITSRLDLYPCTHVSIARVNGDVTHTASFGSLAKNDPRPFACLTPSFVSGASKMLGSSHEPGPLMASLYVL